MRVMVLLFLLNACATSWVAAQIRPGDFVVASNSPSYPGLGVVDAVTGRITRFVNTPHLVSHVTMAPTNDAVIATAEYIGCTLDDPLLYAFDPGTGSLTTYASATINNNICGNGGLFVDQDGSLIYAHQESHRSGIWRFQKGSGTRLTLIDWRVEAMTRDADTGDWIFDVERNQQGALLRFSRNRITTIGTGGGAYGILHDQATGHFWSIHYTGILLRDRSTGLTLRTVNPPGYGASFATIDDVTGEFHAVSGYYNYVVRIAPNGSVLRVWGPFANLRLSGLVIWGTRTMSGSGPVTPGSTCNVTLSFPRSPRTLRGGGVALGAPARPEAPVRRAPHRAGRAVLDHARTRHCGSVARFLGAARPERPGGTLVSCPGSRASRHRLHAGRGRDQYGPTPRSRLGPLLDRGGAMNRDRPRSRSRVEACRVQRR